jgi:sterol desaturase/sphingolipid hydroxylase (fatty acid hydroxylase superfamily)
MFHWILAIFALCFLLERVRPGWRLPKVPTWAVRVLLVNAVQLAVVLLAGVTWEHWMAGRALIHGLRDLPPIAGGLLAYFIATFAFYWWHRWRHEVHFLWLGFHQIHHSPRRLEVITSFYKHPAEMIVNSLLGSAIVYLLLGLSLEAGAIYTACTAIGEFFYHTNVTTPRWVGYFFQRPEMHRIHHQHGHHQNNYGDIVWWDMIFGTYENPRTWDDACGFGPAEEEQLGKMLAWRDVNTET